MGDVAAAEGAGSKDVDVDLTNGSPSEDGMIDVFDERAQASLDAEILVAGTKQLRTQLAQSKINLKLAQFGLLEAPGQDLHPEKFKIEVRKGRQAIDLLKELWSQMGPEGIPESKLDIARLTDLPKTP